MIKWSFCNTDVPEYRDLLVLSRNINYNKHRMRSLLTDPAGSGYHDQSLIQQAITRHIDRAEELSDEYRYMVMMYWKDMDV